MTRCAWASQRNWGSGIEGLGPRAESEVSAGLVCLAAASLAGILGFMLLELLGSAKGKIAPYALFLFVYIKNIILIIIVIICIYIYIYIGSNLFDLSLRRRAAAGPGLASTSSTRFRPKMAWRRTWPGAERKPRVDFGRRWFRLFHVADRTVSKGGDCAIDLLSRRQRSGPCEVSILKSDWMKAIAVGGLTRDSL